VLLQEVEALDASRCPEACISLRYTDKTVKKTFSLLLLCTLATLSLAEETSFHRIKVPDKKGKPVAAVLTFSDIKKSIEIQPAKGDGLSIPYAEIVKFAYEYTKRHRITESTIATAPIGIGAVFMMTKSKSHWLEIDYREEDIPRTYVVRMDKRNYLRILDAVKAHTGKDAEVLGNADKR
jgi:hypothetical protein